MQEPKVPQTPDPNNPNNPNNPNPNDGGGGTPPPNEPPVVSTETILESIGQQLGGSPADDPRFAEASEVEKAILEEQYAAKVERTFDRMKQQVKNKKPDATDNQIHQIGLAFMQGNIENGIDAMEQILRQEKEMEDKNQEQKDLHVEGGAGGSMKEDGRGEGLAGVFKGMANTYSQRGNEGN